MRNLYFRALATVVAVGAAGTTLSAQSTADTTAKPTSTTTTRTTPAGDTVTTTTSRGTYVTSSTAGDTVHKTSVKFGIEGGAMFPLAELKDSFNTGWNGGVLLDVFNPALPVGIRFQGLYSQLPSKVSGASKLKVAGGDVDLVFNIPVQGGVRPYLLGGVGVYSLDAGSGNDPFGTGSTTHFAANGGAGIRMDFSGFGAFIEGRYLNLFAPGTDTKMVPVVFGIMFGSSSK